jgi:hypothetical protein
MGATVQIALITWFGSSLLEWRMGRKNETVHKMLVNPFIGVIISLLLGALMGSVAGAGVGIGVVVGNGLGLATNELTYNFFESLSRMFAAISRGRTRCHELAVAHSRRLQEAKRTIILGFKGLAAIAMLVLFIVGLPFRAAEFIQRNIPTTTTRRNT